MQPTNELKMRLLKDVLNPRVGASRDGSTDADARLEQVPYWRRDLARLTKLTKALTLQMQKLILEDVRASRPDASSDLSSDESS